MRNMVEEDKIKQIAVTIKQTQYDWCKENSINISSLLRHIIKERKNGDQKNERKISI